MNVTPSLTLAQLYITIMSKHWIINITFYLIVYMYKQMYYYAYCSAFFSNKIVSLTLDDVVPLCKSAMFASLNSIILIDKTNITYILCIMSIDYSFSVFMLFAKPNLYKDNLFDSFNMFVTHMDI